MAGSQEEFQDWILAGRVAAQALSFGKEKISAGKSVMEILDNVEQFILENGAIPAFPAQISVNEVAAHFCPTSAEDYTLKEGDVVKLDVGACVNGAIGDCAFTVDLSGGKHEKLLEASKKALHEALSLVKPGILIREISEAIQKAIKSYGFSPVRNLSGHTMDLYNIHTDPSIPNVPFDSPHRLMQGQVIAIEPFATPGDGVVEEKGKPNVFMLKSERNTRHPYAREILKLIKNSNGLPFSRRLIEKSIGAPKTALGLSVLSREGIIAEFPPLVEKTNSLVSQFEHTVIVLEKPVITTLID